LLPKSVRNAQQGDLVPLLNTSQSSASALAVGRHPLVLSAGAGDLPLGIPHTTCAGFWFEL